jgi:hypothetical protein
MVKSPAVLIGPQILYVSDFTGEALRDSSGLLRGAAVIDVATDVAERLGGAAQYD